MLFGRRRGIRAEMYTDSWIEDGNRKTVHYARSWEAVCALAETCIRNALSWRPQFSRVRVWIPVMQTPQGIPVFQSPYLFAIAFDTAPADFTSQAAASTATISHTCTGSNLVVVGLCAALTGAGSVTGVTYATVAMSLAVTADSAGDGGETYIWILTGPATGANNMVFTADASIIFRESSASYTGCAQSGQPDGTGTNITTLVDANEKQVTATSTVANTWGLMLAGNDRGTPVADTNATLRTSRAGAGYGYFDSAGGLGTAGTETMGWHVAGTGNNSQSTSMALIKEVQATGPANLKTYNTNAKANIKTMNTNAIANVKTFDTNA